MNEAPAAFRFELVGVAEHVLPMLSMLQAERAAVLREAVAIVKMRLLQMAPTAAVTVILSSSTQGAFNIAIVPMRLDEIAPRGIANIPSIDPSQGPLS